MYFAGYYLSEKHTQPSIPEVIAYHSQNCGGLITRLRFHPHEKPAPPTVGLGHGMIHHTVIVFNGLAVGKMTPLKLSEIWYILLWGFPILQSQWSHYWKIVCSAYFFAAQCLQLLD